MALPGLFFDTAKTELRADSKAHLDEMIKLLRAQASARVFIVGHTDKVGSFEANQGLSLGRAQAALAAAGGGHQASERQGDRQYRALGRQHQ